MDQRRLLFVLVISGLYMIAEVVGGYLTNSLALLADAGHMFSDVAALGLSAFAIRIASLPPSAKRSFGYHRTEILAALANGATLVAISVFVVIEAIHRLRAPEPVAGGVMLVVAVGGLIANAIGLWVLHGGKDANLNVRGAWLHVLTDALGSVAVIVGSVLVLTLGWTWADPVMSIVISLLVTYSAWALLRESVSILMESTPAHLDADDVRQALRAVDGVQDVHDLHIWSITSGIYAVSTHVVVDPEHHCRVLGEVRLVLHDRFGIDHSTVQCEPPGFVEHHVHA